MKRYLSILILLLASTASAAEVVVPVNSVAPGAATVEILSRAANESVQPMDCVRIWLDVTPENAKTLRYGCHPDPKLIQAGLDIESNRMFLIFQGGRKSSFGLFVSWLDDGNHLKKYVINTGGGPDPDPFPKPNPNPGKRKIIILEESKQRTANQAKIITSQKLRSYLESKNHPKLRVTDVDNVPTDSVPPGKLPLLVIEDGSGNVVYSGSLPVDVDSTIETIKAHGG